MRVECVLVDVSVYPVAVVEIVRNEAVNDVERWEEGKEFAIILLSYREIVA
jgi:hypothetical protein